jgi:hypothetical protein
MNFPKAVRVSTRRVPAALVDDGCWGFEIRLEAMREQETREKDHKNDAY